MNRLVGKGSVIVIVGANLNFPVLFLFNSANITFEHTACPTSGPNTLAFVKCGSCCHFWCAFTLQSNSFDVAFFLIPDSPSVQNSHNIAFISKK